MTARQLQAEERMAGRAQVLIWAAAVATASCSQAVSGKHGVDSQARPRTALEVANYNLADVDVYFFGAGARWRLGMVPSMQTQTFEIPGWMLTGSERRLVVHRIGSAEDYTTDAILVERGQRIHWDVESILSRSTYSVR